MSGSTMSHFRKHFDEGRGVWEKIRCSREGVPPNISHQLSYPSQELSGRRLENHLSESESLHVLLIITGQMPIHLSFLSDHIKFNPEYWQSNRAVTFSHILVEKIKSPCWISSFLDESSVLICITLTGLRTDLWQQDSWVFPTKILQLLLCMK